MSHFTVLVIGDDWEDQLYPFEESSDNPELDHRFIFNDVTEKYKKEYLNDSSEKIEMPDGRLLSPWDDEFRENGQYGFGSSAHKVPENLKRKQVPFTEQFSSFEMFVDKWTGIKPNEDGRYGYYTNPNARWDWYQMGGRWMGFFKLKDPKVIENNVDYISELSLKHNIEKEKIIELEKVLKENPNKVYDLKLPNIYKLQNDLEEKITIKYENGVVGRSGVMTKPAKFGWVDQAKKKDIDFEGMKNEVVNKNEKHYDEFHKILNGRSIPIWDDLLKKNNGNVKETRDEYNNDPVIKDINDNKFYWGYEDLLKPKEEYLKGIRGSAIITYSVIKDYKWYEQGEMGWWGISSNEKDQDKWNEEFNELIESIPDDTLLTIVDCHV